MRSSTWNVYRGCREYLHDRKKHSGKLAYLLISDLHLTDNPRDEYRWDIFGDMDKVIRERNVGEIFILGDITDKKDNHSAKLVNLIFEMMEKFNIPVKILRGNHDYVDPASPFFQVLSSIHDVVFIGVQDEVAEPYGDILFLPNVPHPIWRWQDIKVDYLKSTSIILMHQTVTGSVASSGFEMTGLPLEFFDRFPNLQHIFSGDIHVPQTLGDKLTYVGAPYHTNFGDGYEPRMILLWRNSDSPANKWQWESIPTKFPRKLKIDVTHPDELHSHTFDGDQVKVVLNLSRSDLVYWNEYRQKIHDIMANKPAELCGITLKEQSVESKPMKFISATASSEKIFDDFCDKEDISGDLKKYGKELLDAPKEPRAKGLQVVSGNSPL